MCSSEQTWVRDIIINPPKSDKHSGATMAEPKKQLNSRYWALFTRASSEFKKAPLRFKNVPELMDMLILFSPLGTTRMRLFKVLHLRESCIFLCFKGKWLCLWIHQLYLKNRSGLNDSFRNYNCYLLILCFSNILAQTEKFCWSL